MGGGTLSRVDVRAGAEARVGALHLLHELEDLRLGEVVLAVHRVRGRAHLTPIITSYRPTIISGGLFEFVCPSRTMHPHVGR